MFVLVEALHWVGVLFMVLMWMTRTWIKTKEYYYLYATIKAGFYTYSNGLDAEEFQLLKSGNDEAVRFYKIFFCMITSGCFASMLRDPIFGGNIHEEGSEVTRLKFYNTWMPFAVNTWTRYGIVCTFQLFLGLSVLFQTVAIFTITICCLIHLSTSFKLLQLKISKAHIYASKDAQKYEDYLYKQLVECATHHQTLIRFFDTFHYVSSLSFLITYLNSGVIICAVGYILTGPDSNLRSAMAFLFVVATEMVFFGGTCYYGERIIQESSKIHESVYNTPWYEQSKRIVFLYHMMMIRSRKPLVVTAYGLKDMSLSTFGDILQASYSYFNMLIAARK